MEDSKKRWLIKDAEGRVRGPFHTDDILARISRGELSGDEMISLYPGADWVPMSREPEFYDQLLEFLEDEQRRIPDEVKSKVKVGPSDEADGNMPDDFVVNTKSTSGSRGTVSKVDFNTGTGPSMPPKRGRVERVQKSEGTKPDESEAGTKTTGPDRSEKSSSTSRASRAESASEPVIELKKKKKVVRKEKARRSAVPLLLMLIALGLAWWALQSGNEEGRSDLVSLVVPRKDQPAKDAIAIKKLVESGVGAYTQDIYSGYVRAQADLVQAIEGDPRNEAVMALLCLTYLELWPYTAQGSSDLQSISLVTQMAGQVDPAGVETATCRAVELLIRGRLIEATNLTESVLETFAGSGKPPIAFYFFKSLLLGSKKEYAAGVNYAQSAQQLWPRWVRVYSLEAEMLGKMGQFEAAATRYQQILKSSPSHKVAMLELGAIEIQHLKNYEAGKKMLEQAFSLKERAPREVESRAYFSLAKLAFQTQDSRAALKYAQKAYSMNSLNEEARELILSIGGEDKLKEVQIPDGQYVYEGDQFVREGDCRAAQALYKAAYEVNPKNAVAAMKAAECLWQLSLTSEAIDWLNRAIRADAKLIDAYILLADYFALRHNYVSAAQILSKARSEFPNSYKVYRGLANFELRRNNLPNAVKYAEKAISLYEADVDSYVILAKAQMLLHEFAKAFTTAGKAVEVEINNRDAQIVYAQALAGSRGAHLGIEYMLKLVNLYPTISQYRQALAEMYMADQKYNEAKEVFGQVIRIEEKPKTAFLGLGKVYQLEKNYEKALETYLRAAALDPADVEPLFLAGLLYLDAKKPADAKQQFLRVLRVNKDYPLVNYYIGKAALMMDSPEEALEQANLEMQKNPGLADPYILQAEAYTVMGQYSLCAGAYQRAVKFRSQGADIYVKMSRCYRMSGNLDAASMMIEQANQQESGNPEVWKEQGAVFETRGDKLKAIRAYEQYIILAPNAVDRGQIEMRMRALSQ